MKKLGLTLLIVVLLGMPAMALAQEKPAAPAPAPAVKADDALGLKGILKGAVLGAVIGLTVSLLGFAKDKAADKKFDLKAAAPTILMGVAIGALFGWDQKDLASFKEWKEAAATVLIGELGLKAGWRNAEPIITNIMSAILGRKNGV